MRHWSNKLKKIQIRENLFYVHGLDEFSSVAHHIQLFATPWTAACQASQSLLKLMLIELAMPPNHLILSHPLLLLPSIFPSIRVFSSESILCIKWPKYWSFSFSINPSSEYSGLISFRMDWLDLLAVQGEQQESSPRPQFKSINSLDELILLKCPWYSKWPTGSMQSLSKFWWHFHTNRINNS